MLFKKSLLLLFMGILLNGCATKEYSKQESVFIVFKTPTFRYADLGFIYENDKDLKIEMYSSGQAIMSLEISQNAVCMSLLECMSKKSFNEKVLSSSYPKNILDNIFKGQKIFDGVNVLKTSNGFTQKLMKHNKYNINYSVLNKQILFHDRMNDIVIKIKRLE